MAGAPLSAPPAVSRRGQAQRGGAHARVQTQTAGVGPPPRGAAALTSNICFVTPESLPTPVRTQLGVWVRQGLDRGVDTSAPSSIYALGAVRFVANHPFGVTRRLHRPCESLRRPPHALHPPAPGVGRSRASQRPGQARRRCPRANCQRARGHGADATTCAAVRVWVPLGRPPGPDAPVSGTAPAPSV